MKRIVSALLCLVLTLSLVGCANGKTTGSNSVQSIYQPTAVENVSFRISNVSSTGATVIIKDINKEPYVYGEEYAIEQRKNGQWHKVETLIDNYGFTSIGLLTDINREVKFSINWEWLYGELAPGDYRLLKFVNEQKIYIEFSIN